MLARLPFVCSMVLLTAQLVLPWTVPHFITQDGPSHVYSAVVARDLLIQRTSIQRQLYHLRPGVIPNWTATVLLSAIATLVGAGNAERVMVDLCIILGVFSFRYCARALAGGPLALTPLVNFLFNTWFLWLGFYNFSLGMALCPFVIGFFIYRRKTLGAKGACQLSLGCIFIFFTHLIPAMITVLALLCITFWTHGTTQLTKAALRESAVVVASVLPTILLMAVYASGKPSFGWAPGFEGALEGFPLHVFATTSGRVGGQSLLVPGMLLYLAVSTLGMRRPDWVSEKGALAATMCFLFFVYLLVPDEGLGGSMTKIRFSWAVFLLGGLVAASVRPRLSEAPVAIYITVLLACNLFATWKTLQLTSKAAGDYIESTDRIPTGATFVRIHFPTPKTTARYGLSGIGRDPFFHLDAYSASRRGSVDVSDYEGLNPIFPLALRPRIGEGQRTALWALEGADETSSDSLTWLRAHFAVPIDYVVVVSDGDLNRQSPPGLDRLTSQLNRDMHLFASSPNGFVRVYQRQNQRVGYAEKNGSKSRTTSTGWEALRLRTCSASTSEASSRYALAFVCGLATGTFNT